MSLNVGMKLGCGKRSTDHIAFQLGHIYSVGGKPAHCFIKCGGNVAHLKHKAGHHTAIAAAAIVWRARHNDKTRCVIVIILNILRQNIKTVNFACQAAGKRCQTGIGGLGDMFCRTGSVGSGNPVDAMFA